MTSRGNNNETMKATWLVAMSAAVNIINTGNNHSNKDVPMAFLITLAFWLAIAENKYKMQ
jgi:hypothetical protein